jgi:phage shock protein PspC (stress-responsive transcriptional regulator)
MLGLDFEITRTMILTTIFGGGFCLIISQYFITKLTMIKIIGLNN